MSDSEANRAGLVQEFEAFSASDPTHPVAAANDLFDRGRGVCPVAHSSTLGGYWLFLKDKDVRAAVLDPAAFTSGPSVARPLAAPGEEQHKRIPLDLDDPEHAVWRPFFTGAVTPQAVERVHGFLKADVIRMLDAMAARGHGDMATELANIIPVRAIVYLLGFEDEASQKTIQTLNDAMIADYHDPVKTQQHRIEFAQFAWSEALKRRAAPRNDALTDLANAQVAGKPLGPPELAQIVNTLLFGGSGNTATALCYLTHEVLSRPDLRAQLIADPSLIPAAADESMRLHSPLSGLHRMTAHDVEVSGQALPAGTSIMLCWQSANLDPDAYPDPHAFRLDRPRGHHLSFGKGLHVCPGEPLARMQLQLVIEQLLERHPTARLASDAPVGAVFLGSNNIVAVPSLPLVFG